MAAASAWAHLHADLLGRVLRYLPCIAHRVAFAAVCTKWLAAARQPSPPLPLLPWLLLPSAGGREPCFFCLRCRTTHRAVLPADVHGARWCGSFRPGWIFVALQQSRGYAVHNLHTGQRLLLPEILRTPDPVDDHGMFIHATRFARTQDGTGYLAAVVERSASTIAFWRLDAEAAAGHWAPPMPAELQERGSWTGMLPRTRIADVLYYGGHGLEGFHVLTDREEELLVYVPGSGPDGALATRLVTYRFPRHEVTQPLRLEERFTMARYLVNYFGDLLMVVRAVLPEEITLGFRVLKLATEPAQADEHGNREASWEPMHVIPTGILFLGRCSSKVYPSHGIDVDGVYFLDDATNFHDADRALKSPATRQYPCSDMGYLPLTSYGIQRIFPARPPSEYSRAVWFFQ